MPIIETVEQLADFLEQNEEWRRRIFNILVPRELARLPAEFEEFRAETRREFDAVRQEMRSGFARVDEQFARVDERFVQVNERIAQAEREIESLRAEMREGFARVDERFAQVDREFEAVRREMREGFEQLRAEMREGYAELAQKIQRNTDDIAELKGKSLEREYRDKARSIFGRYFRSVAVIDWIDLEDALEAVAPLSDAERTELSVVDLLVRGRRRTDGQETVLVIEVSWTITRYDVERAVRRAQLFRQRGFTADPDRCRQRDQPRGATCCAAGRLRRRAGRTLRVRPAVSGLSGASRWLVTQRQPVRKQVDSRILAAVAFNPRLRNRE
jgi:uncharacterized membrane-anchored protein YhcB (DUF1043 family)